VRILMTVVLSTAVSTTALATGAGAQTPPARGSMTNPVSESLRNSWNGAKRNISESAEQMPEADYAFRPVDTVRTFGEILAHVAGANYAFCASAKGEKAPYAEDHFEKTAKTKAAIVKAVTDSHAYCDGAYTAVTDVTAGQMVANPFGSGQSPRSSQLIGNIGHVNEHYGNLVTYFRIKGLVPPSSRRQ
jgi:uncharacterized damage-inducible protein DinB